MTDLEAIARELACDIVWRYMGRHPKADVAAVQAPILDALRKAVTAERDRMHRALSKFTRNPTHAEVHGIIEDERPTPDTPGDET